jgi:hypothetical protein
MALKQFANVWAVTYKKTDMYKNEIEMYPDIISWLTTDLNQKFGKKAKNIQVLDTHDSDLSNFIMKLNYQKFFSSKCKLKMQGSIRFYYQNLFEL